MLRTTLVALVTATALSAPTAQAAQADARPATSIVGTWKGKVHNEDGPAGYSGTVRLTRSQGTLRATVKYSHGLASTRWTYRDRSNGWFRFWEASRSSRAGAPGVAIRVKRSGAKLLVRYRVPGSGYTGYMNARRLR